MYIMRIIDAQHELKFRQVYRRCPERPKDFDQVVVEASRLSLVWLSITSMRSGIARSSAGSLTSNVCLATTFCACANGREMLLCYLAKVSCFSFLEAVPN